jgi:hypothetical protein
MTALLLMMLGVDRETIRQDYALSMDDPATANTQAIVHLLDEVDRQGGIESYLADIGVSPEVQHSIRESLLK